MEIGRGFLIQKMNIKDDKILFSIKLKVIDPHVMKLYLDEYMLHFIIIDKCEFTYSILLFTSMLNYLHSFLCHSVF